MSTLVGYFMPKSAKQFLKVKKSNLQLFKTSKHLNILNRLIWPIDTMDQMNLFKILKYLAV